MRICSKLQQATIKDTFIELTTDAVSLRIYYLSDDIVRIRAGFDGDFAEDIIKELVAEGFSGDKLISEFNERYKKRTSDR